MFIADTSKQLACRRDFMKGAACTGAVAAIPRMAYAEEDKIAMWQRETERITPGIYKQYLNDGNTRRRANLFFPLTWYTGAIRNLRQCLTLRS